MLVMTMKKLDPLYTVADTAKILNVSEKTVRRLIKDEALRAIDFRREDGRLGAVRVGPADLDIRDHRSRQLTNLVRVLKSTRENFIE